MKKVILTLLLFTAVMTFTGRTVVAADDSSSQGISNVFQSAKEALDTLIVTKDSGDLNDTDSRVKAFLRVLDLSIVEAKDYAAKLVAVPKNDDYNTWIEESLKALTDRINYFTDLKKKISNSSPSLEEIKKIASNFKEWREKEYVPIIKSFQTFFLIEQENNALDVASKRLTNIKKDLAKISFKAKDKKVVEGYISSSSRDIDDAKLLNENAYKMFLELYVKGKGVKEIEDVQTVNEDEKITVEINDETKVGETEEIKKEGKDEKQEEVLTDESIRVLVKNSLEKVKSAYQDFIDLSNYVRKLLK